jgi:hypothetical protein
MVTGKNQHLGDFTGRIYPLSRWRERVGVRVEKQAIG